MFFENISDFFDVSDETKKLCEKANKNCEKHFVDIDDIGAYNQAKVLNAMCKHKLSELHFASSTGYGYNDLGRHVLEAIYAEVFGGEGALVRPQLVSGTHALKTALFGNLRHGDELISAVGTPYDTLQGVIGIRETRGSLVEHGVIYKEVSLIDGNIDYNGIKESITSKTKLVLIQRSRGYEWRNSIDIEEVEKLISFIKNIREDIICMVDNCYCEFVSSKEPCDVGADLAVGSLIKNPGGGLAPVGGYIVGKNKYVDLSAATLYAPGLEKEVGPTLGMNGVFLQGLFLAPSVVASSLKTAVFASHIMEELGYEVSPKANDRRTDIVQAIKLNSPEKIIAFCKGVQSSAPVDSFVVPEPSPMPGYDCPVIMAAGAFVQGSSIEFSADAPMKEPYIVFLQGSLTWYHGKVGIMLAVDKLLQL